MQISSRWVTRIGGIALVALMANAAIASYNVNSLILGESVLYHNRQVISELEGVLSAMKDAETGQRGYQVTGILEYLEPFEATRLDIEHRIEVLRGLTENDPKQEAAISELHQLIQNEMSILQNLIELRNEMGREAARDAIIRGRGKETMDAIRQKVAEISDDARLVMDLGTASARKKYHATIITNLAGVGVGIAMMLFTYSLMQKESMRRRKAEREIADSEERFRTLAETLPQIVWATRPNGEVEYWNPKWYSFTGSTVEDSLGLNWTTPIHPDDRERTIMAWKNAIRTGENYSIESRFQCWDGTYRWFLGLSQPQRDNKGKIVRWIGTLTDIEEKKQQAEILERRVAERTAELVQLNAMLNRTGDELRTSNQELEKFAYVASHDLQEPLRKIQAFGNLLMSKYGEDLEELGRDYVSRMNSSASRMRALIDDLLRFSRIAARNSPFDLVDLFRIVEEVRSDLEVQLAEAGATLQIGSLPTLYADATQIRQVFQNLISNSIKFHREGSPPMIRISSKKLTDVTSIEVPVTFLQGWRITFDDNGIGFENEYREKIFEVFQRLHSRTKFEGTGIGLAIVKKIVERHAGQIVAQGKPGHGSVFTIDLPDRPLVSRSQS
jgi:PAS domain S-box-containing protein